MRIRFIRVLDVGLGLSSLFGFEVEVYKRCWGLTCGSTVSWVQG